MGIRRGCCAQAVHPDPFADAGKLPAVEATLGLRKRRSLQPWNEEAQRMRACVGAAFAEAARAAKEAEVRWRQEEGERRRRSKLVHNIALCEKPGLTYSIKGATCAPPSRRG